MAKRDGVFERKDRPGWFCSYVDAGGKRRRRKLQAHTRQQALTMLAAIKTKVEREKVLGVKEIVEVSTAELFERFRKHQKAHVRPTTYARTDAILTALAAKLPAALKDVTRAAVSEFIAKRAAEVSPGTIHKEVAILKHALRMAVEWDLLLSNPAERARVPRLAEGRTRYLSPAELKAAIAAAPEWLRAPLALAAFTGMRRGELLGLKWTDVDLASRRLYLRETKNGSLRVLPLNDLAMRVLESLPRSGSHLFAGFTPENLSVTARRVFASLKIEDASFHSLRHTAASWLVMEGVDLYAVGQVLGHRTPRMTQRYAHLSPGYVANAVSRLDGALAGVLDSGDATGTNSGRLDAASGEILRRRAERKPHRTPGTAGKKLKRAG